MPNHSSKPAAAEGVRVDIWLWAARFFKTRALAKQAIGSGKVEIAGQAVKASRHLHGGEALVVRRGEETFEIEVLGVSAVRGAAPVAQLLYRESDESKAKRLEANAQRRAERAGYQAPQGKPDKRARRLIRALGDIDAM